MLLDAQDRTRWDRLRIARGLASLTRALGLGGAAHPYVLQASIAACHACAAKAADADWTRIAALYGTLARVAPSPVVELNRAVAVSRASGAAAALPLVEAIRNVPALRDYAMLHAVHGDLLAALGRHDEAQDAFGRAAALPRSPAMPASATSCVHVRRTVQPPQPGQRGSGPDSARATPRCDVRT